ncbi:MAG TPA: membrane dipeptidase [Acidobacteriota bacterium]
MSIGRRRFLGKTLWGGLGLLAAPLAQFGRGALEAAAPAQVSARAVDLVLGSTVVDMLGLLTLDWPKLYAWYRNPADFAEPDYRKLEASGVNIFHPAIETSSSDSHQAVLRWLRGWNRLLERENCFLARIEGINDLLHVPKLGKLGVLIGFQNSNHFRSAADVGPFYALGQRVSQLTYNQRNRIGSGCFEAHDRGLTGFGAGIIAAMNDSGMAVDISHCGERTSLDALAASSKPVLVTHSNCRALVPGQPRCKSDAVIKQLAAGGGVMGITIVRGFVGRSAAPSLEDLLDHFDHVARLVGPEHVGLGSDVDVEAVRPATGKPDPLYAIRGLDPALRVFQIADGLLRRGYGAPDVGLILGGNFLRVLAAIFPDASWHPVPQWQTQRDPFCPAPLSRVR